MPSGLLSAAQTIILVTLVTGFIWLYAESENVKERAIDVQIRLVAPPGRDLLIEPESAVRVRTISLASTAQVAELQQIIDSGPLQLVVYDDPTAESSTQTLNMAAAISQHPVIEQLGLSIDRCVPAVLEARVERFQSHEVPIEIRAQGVEIGPNPTVEPAMARMTLPASLSPGIESAVVLAQLDRRDVRGLAENVTHQLRVPLAPPLWLQGPEVTLEPKHAQVSFSLVNTNVELTRSGVPVFIVGPPGELSKYRIEVQPFLDQDVTLVGPREAIEAIRDNGAEVYAELRLTADELERGIESKPVTIRSPQQVRLASEIPVVELSIERRAEP